MSEKDYHKIFGGSKTATTEEIKKAYRELAMLCHPDRNLGNKEAEEKFKEVNEAYKILEKEAKLNTNGDEILYNQKYKNDFNPNNNE